MARGYENMALCAGSSWNKAVDGDAVGIVEHYQPRHIGPKKTCSHFFHYLI
jgi:hypothetical protein